MAVSLHTNQGFWWRGVHYHPGDTITEASDYWGRVLNWLRLTGTAGGGAPEWGLDFDFAAGTYVVDGNPVSLTSVVASDEVDSAPFDAESVIPGTGYASSGTYKGGMFIGDAGSYLTNEPRTLVFEFEAEDIEDGGIQAAMMFQIISYTEDYNNYYKVRARLLNDMQVSWGSGPSRIAVGTNKLAITFMPNKVSASLNGEAVASVNPNQDLIGDRWTFFFEQGITLVSVKAKNAVDDADLLALSAL